MASCEHVWKDAEGDAKECMKCGRIEESKVLDVDNVILCAGQEPARALVEGLNKPHHLIGGADVAAELDAKRAIDQGTRLALTV